jgi:hypothetical protein
MLSRDEVAKLSLPCRVERRERIKTKRKTGDGERNKNKTAIKSMKILQ